MWKGPSTVEGVAVPGARALGVAIQVAKDTADRPAADLVVLEAGANDVGESSIRVWSQTFRRLLTAVERTSPDAEVVCLGPWGPPRGAELPSPDRDAYVEELETRVARLEERLDFTEKLLSERRPG